MSAYQLACKACGKAIPAADVNIDKAIARCLACNAVFSIAGAAAEERERPTVPMPKRFQVEGWGPELTITRRWYTHGLWFLLAFCIFWDGFLVVWYAAGIGTILGGREASFMGWIMLAFPILHVAVGVLLTYATIGGFVNRTVLRVAGGELAIWHGPLPWPGQRRLMTSDIRQLYCTQTSHRRKHGSSFTFNVAAQTSGGDKIDLLTGLDELDQALFIEQRVEQHLRIRDERVPGEVRV
jgi:hypothetical protein